VARYPLYSTFKNKHSVSCNFRKLSNDQENVRTADKSKFRLKNSEYLSFCEVGIIYYYFLLRINSNPTLVSDSPWYCIEYWNVDKNKIECKKLALTKQIGLENLNFRDNFENFYRAKKKSCSLGFEKCKKTFCLIEFNVGRLLHFKGQGFKS
jgi:hypothetical protein